MAGISAYAVIALGLGPRALIASHTQGAIAVFLLQAVYYLQHSGLERPEGTRIAPAHFWQSDRVLGRFLLLELPRHADHQGHAASRTMPRSVSSSLPPRRLGWMPGRPESRRRKT